MYNREEIFEILENSDKVPKIHYTVKEILDLLRDPDNLDIEELSDKISSYDELRNLFLNCINSNYFFLNREITSAKEAVVYFGMKTVQNLIISFITQILFSNQRSTTQLFNRNKYLKHSLGTSIAASILSEKTGLSKRFELFSYGLIHDIGIPILERCAPDILDEIVKLQLKGLNQLAAERYIMGGLTHSDIGVWICDKWDLPRDIRNIVEFHHKPLLAKEDTVEVKLIYLGDMISTNYYEKLLGIKPHDIFNKVLMESIGAKEEYIKYIGDILPQEIENVHNLHIFSL